VDVLEVGRSGPTRRTLVLLAVPLLVVAASLLLVDQKARATEAAGLDRCATRTHAAVHEATARMAGILGYVRPVWSYRIPRHVERSLDALVSRSAAGAGGPLQQVRRSCAAVDVLAVHPGLRSRQAACVGLLDTYARFLREVVRDGHRATGEWPEDDGSGC
jgi:hypothetical protein